MRRTILLLLLGAFLSIGGMDQAVATTTSQSSKRTIESYREQDWKPGDTAEQLEWLEEIAADARSKGLRPDYFAAQLYLAQLHLALDFEAYHQHMDQLDSLFAESPAAIGDSLIVEYWLKKSEGLLLEQYLAEAYQHLIYAQELGHRMGSATLDRKIRDSFAYYHLFSGELRTALAIKIGLHLELLTSPELDSTRWRESLNGLGVVLSLNREYKLSNQAFQLMLRHLEPGERELATVYYRMGENEMKLGHLESSEKYLQMALEEDRQRFGRSDFGETIRQHLGRLYSLQGKYSRSNAYFQSTLPHLDSLRMFNQLRFAHLNIAMNQFKRRNDTVGSAALVSYQIALDSIARRRRVDLERKYAAHFESLEKEAEIRELELEGRREASEKLAFAGLAAFLLIALLFGVYRWRSSRKIVRQRLKLEGLEREKLARKLEHSREKLSRQVELLQERGRILEDLKHRMEGQEARQEIVATLQQNYIEEKSWDGLILQFETLHPGFIQDLQTRSDRITLNDTKLAVLIKLGYTTASIAEVMNISRDGVRKARQRLRDKIGEVNFSNISA